MSNYVRNSVLELLGFQQVAHQVYNLLHKLLNLQLMQKKGYRTHMIGKWHLGFESKAYTPIMRGFHSFTGFYNGMQVFSCLFIFVFQFYKINESKQILYKFCIFLWNFNKIIHYSYINLIILTLYITSVYTLQFTADELVSD